MTKGKILFQPLYMSNTILTKLLKDLDYEYSWIQGDDILTQEKLREYDALIMDDRELKNWDEKQAIIEFVIENNGSLFITKIPYSFFYQKEYLKGANRHNHLQEITKVFGIDFNEDFNHFEFWYELQYKKKTVWEQRFLRDPIRKEEKYKIDYKVEEHPLTKGVKKLYSPDDFHPLEIDKKIAEALMHIQTDNLETVWCEGYKGIFPILAINKNYPVAVLSSPYRGVFDDKAILHDDNEQFARNLCDWLCEKHRKEIHEPSKTFSFMYNSKK